MPIASRGTSGLPVPLHLGHSRVLIKLGAAFDVVGERKQLDFRVDNNAKWMEEDIEIKLRNRKIGKSIPLRARASARTAAA